MVNWQSSLHTPCDPAPGICRGHCARDTITLVCKQYAQMGDIIRLFRFERSTSLQQKDPAILLDSDWKLLLTDILQTDFIITGLVWYKWLWWASQAPKRPLKLSDLNSTQVLKWELKRMIQFNIYGSHQKVLLWFSKISWSNGQLLFSRQTPPISSCMIIWALRRILNDIG